MNDVMTKALSNWRDFNDLLATIPEADLKEMLVYEVKHENRKSFVERLHQRYNSVRIMRERGELMKGF
jgi:hypothetical protein